MPTFFLQVLAQICVQIISRISFVSPACCDDLLMLSLAEPLLPLIQSRRARGARVSAFSQMDMKEEEDLSKSGEFAVLFSEAMVAASAEALLAVVTLCPVVPTLTSSLSRSGAGCAMLLLGLHATTFAIARNSQTALSAFAFCGHFIRCAGEAAATDLEKWILLPSSPSPPSFAEPKEATMGVGSSGGLEVREKCANSKFSSLPSLLVLGDQHPRRAPSSSSSISIEGILRTIHGENLDGGRAKIKEEETEGDAGVDIDALLQLAALSANLGEGGSAEGAGGATLLGVAERGRAVCSLLLQVHDTNSSSALAPSASSSAPTPAATVASILFLRSLRSFLLGNDSELIPEKDEASSGCVEKDPKPRILHQRFDRGLCGLLVMIMQAHLEMPMLLTDGE